VDGTVENAGTNRLHLTTGMLVIAALYIVLLFTVRLWLT
jgi:hypothetical protein